MTEPAAPAAATGLPLRFAAGALRAIPLRFAEPKPSGCPASPLRFSEDATRGLAAASTASATPAKDAPDAGADGTATCAVGSEGASESETAVPGRQVIDEDQLKRMMKDHRGGFFRRNGYQLVTLILIAVNVALYLVEVVLAGLRLDIPSRVLFDLGAMLPLAVQGPTDLWRFVAPMFLHLDLMHLLMNMVALYSVGVTLERILGKASFLALYFVGGITGNVASYAWGLLAEGGATVSAGASTSVFGLFVAVALLGVLARGNRRYLMAYSKGMLAVIAVNVAYSLLVPGISVSGHLGGAVGGAIGMLMVPSKNLRTPKPVCAVAAVLWIAAMAAAICWGMGAAPSVAANLLA